MLALFLVTVVLIFIGKLTYKSGDVDGVGNVWGISATRIDGYPVMKHKLKRKR